MFDVIVVGSGPAGVFAARELRPLRVLMLDVARYKYPPVWIPLPALFAAMNTVDTDSGKTRGFLLVHAAPGTRVPGPVTRSHSRLLTVLVVAPLVFFLLGALTGSWWRDPPSTARSIIDPWL